MNAPSYSTSMPRARLDPHEVDRLIVYAMGALEKHKMSFVNDSGALVCVGTSRGKMSRLVRDALRVFGPEKARRTIDEHIANLIEVERESYRRGFTSQKRKRPTCWSRATAESSELEIRND
ncbi:MULTISPECIES: hypothetical protein [unclassified Microbacterium]|uniref:hypothetical protein n=1 Tax=unclassified Microbacterium TaxID=2609290 RepID=UPI000EA9984F|nr:MULTISPECIES: hypothetical protein [unclassified Microbacterium]MBT2484624.1 hypothetical protein [Microbacterium sp. ISL-108]RKN67516.1 hypothetical protein D7252_07945 [Microbacterium sp. CGR2]